MFVIVLYCVCILTSCFFAASSAAFARLDVAMAVDLVPFEVGQIWTLHREGYSYRQIADKVTCGCDQLGPDVVEVDHPVLAWHRWMASSVHPSRSHKIRKTASRVCPNLA